MTISTHPILPELAANASARQAEKHNPPSYSTRQRDAGNAPVRSKNELGNKP